MTEKYVQAREKGRVFYHGGYRLFNHFGTNAYDVGAIRMIVTETAYEKDAVVTVVFEDGSMAKWTNKWIDAYTSQFGLAVSFDGKYVFIQTWDQGLFCFCSRTGQRLWRTKSKRGITSVFVNENTLLVHQHGRSLQLLDIHNGEVLQEKRPATAWGFTAIDHRHIACQVTERRWEIIDAQNLETKRKFSLREFTGGHESYCVNHIRLEGEELIVCGFKNVWDDSVSPPIRLPNPEFEYRLFLGEL